MIRQKRIVAYLIFSLFAASAANAEELKSPNGNIVLSFSVENVAGRSACPVYSISFRNKPVVVSSRLGFTLAEDSVFGEEMKILSVSTRSHDETWKPVYGERSRIRNHYNELLVKLQQKKPPRLALDLTFRCFDAGVAFCATIRKNGAGDEVHIKQENTEFCFPTDYTVWATNSAQGKYRKTTIDKMGEGIERPLTIEADDSTYLAVAEARLVDYARMKLATFPSRSHCIISRLSSAVQSPLPLTTPWRVIMIAESPGQLLENNDIILNLNDPCAIKDPSWIRPGKLIREISLTTEGGLACVDFAVTHGLQYVEFDAGWYGYEYADSSDATTVSVDPRRSPGPLDLHKVIHYAADRGIGIVLYVNRKALEKQLDQILPLYQKWGVKGVKYGFVQVGSQKWTAWLHEAIRRAAAHHLMVDVHDEYRPTGYSRTYPNFMTQEGIAGDETGPSNQLTLTILFTRMLAGAADNTICYYDQRVDRIATHAYQLAKGVCMYSPWQFLFWYDKPGTTTRSKDKVGGFVMGGEPELEFFAKLPTVWDDTRVIHGRIGEYAVIARRSGENWFIGAMNSGRARTLAVPLRFLQPDKKYVAYIYADDMSVNTRTHVKIQHLLVNKNSMLRVPMLAKGGQAIRIVPAEGK